MAAEVSAERPAGAQLQERVAAALAVVGLGLATVLARSSGGRPLPESPAALTSLYAACFVAMLASAAILRNQFRASHYPPLAFLSNAFGLGALLLLAYVLAMPHVLSDAGFGLGPVALSWLWVTWHAGFTMLALAYAGSEFTFARRVTNGDAARQIGGAYAVAAFTVTALAVATVASMRHDLPPLHAGAGATALFRSVVVPALLEADGATLVLLVLATRLRHSIGLWLSVVLVALGVETYVSGSLVRADFTIAWYVSLATAGIWQLLFLVTQLQRASEQLAALAVDKRSLIEVTLRDPLTGLLNRRAFDERFDDLLAGARLRHKPLSLVVFDIDHFKKFNDAYGHLAGDDALKAIAKAVAPIASKQSEACCRVGGEEFALVLGDTDASGAMSVAEKIRAAVLRLHIEAAPDAEGRHLSVSIGVSTFDPETAIDGLALYGRADGAMYKAKRLGKNRIASFEESDARALAGFGGRP